MAKSDKRAHGSAMGEAVQVLLAAPLDEEGEVETAQLLCSLGLEPDQQSAILLQVIRKAKEGDFRSIQMVRELAETVEGKARVAFSEDLRSMTTEELEGMLGE